MNWRVEFRPEVEQDVAEAVAWYEARQPGLGVEFIAEVIIAWDALAENPFLHFRRHPTKSVTPTGSPIASSMKWSNRNGR